MKNLPLMTFQYTAVTLPTEYSTSTEVMTCLAACLSNCTKIKAIHKLKKKKKRLCEARSTSLSEQWGTHFYPTIVQILG